MKQQFIYDPTLNMSPGTLSPSKDPFKSKIKVGANCTHQVNQFNQEMSGDMWII